MVDKRQLPFGSLGGNERSSKFAVDDRLYDGVGEDFEPAFFKVKKPVSRDIPASSSVLVRRNPNNKFIRKESRSLESLKREWESTLKTEEEKVATLVADVVKVDKRVRAEFVSDLKAHMDSIEQFFVKEVAPIEVALGDAVERARQTVSLITESDVEDASFGIVHTMFQDAIRLKTFDFLCTKLQLTPALRQVLIDKYFKPDARK